MVKPKGPSPKTSPNKQSSIRAFFTTPKQTEEPKEDGDQVMAEVEKKQVGKKGMLSLFT